MTLLQSLNATAWTGAWELLCGAVLVRLALPLLEAARGGRGGGCRRRAAAWRRASRSLLLACPFALATLALSGALQACLGGSLPPLEPLRAGVGGVFLGLASLPTAGIYLVLHAGRLESKGRRRAARGEARAGGKIAFWGATAAFAAGGGASPGLVALVVAGWLALLAGLAGKPRPTGQFAAALWLVASWLLLVAGQGSADSALGPIRRAAVALLTG